MLTGGACAAVIAVATGLGLAGAKDPSLKDQINSAHSDAGQLSDEVDARAPRSPRSPSRPTRPGRTRWS